MRYRAFISYSHAADGKLAPALHSALHRFARPWYRLRALRVFRDQTNLAVNPGLWTTIQQALADSEYFLLLASPEAARSKWVRRELEYWLQNRPRNRIFLVLTEGELVWDGARADFDWSRTTALPETVSGAMAEEPLYLDLRWARTAAQLTLGHPRFRDAVADIAAPLHGVEKDEIIGEDVRQHRRTRAVASAAAIALVLLTLVAWQQRNEARRQQRVAEERLVRMHVANGSRLVDEGDVSGALVWFGEAARLADARPPAGATLRRRFAATARQMPALARAWFPEQPTDTSIAVNGKYVVAFLADGSARVWDSETGTGVASLRRADASVMDVTVGQAGTLVVTAGADGTARIWDARSGADVAALPHDGEIHRAVFTADGERIVTASADQTARVWETRSGRQLASLAHDAAVDDAFFSQDGTTVVTFAADKEVRVWHPGSGTLTSLEDSVPLAQLALNADGSAVLTIDADRAAHLWSAATGKQVSSLGSYDWIDRAEFSPDGRWVAMAKRQGWAIVWDLKTDTEGQSIRLDALPISVAFSPDSTRLVTTCTDRTAQVWNVETGKAVIPPLVHDDTVHQAAFSEDGRQLATVTSGGTIRIWELEGPGATSLEHTDGVRYAAFSRDGTRVLTATTFTVQLWQAASPPPAAVTLATEGQIYAASFSPDGARVVTGSEDRTARVWDTATGALVTTLPHEARVRDAHFSGDATRVVTASGEQVVVWDVPEARKVASMRADDPYPPIAVELTPDGTHVLAVYFGDTIRVWDVATQANVSALQRPETNRAAYSWDGERIVTATTGGVVQVWDAESGKAAAPPIEHGSRVMRVTFSPDGTRLLTAGEGDTARVWDATTSAPVTPPLAHGARVMHATFSPDGTQVLTASADHTARVWDAGTGEAVTPPLRHDGLVRHAEFSPDGERIVTASEDDRARLWDMSGPRGPADELVRRSQLVAAREVDDTGALVPLASDRFRSLWLAAHPSPPP